jgi:PAS domain S-box-containing protein
MYDRIWLDTSGPIPMIAKTVGLLYWIFNIYIMGLLVISIYLLLENMARESALIRRQSRIIAAAIILALGTHLMYLGGVRLLGVLNPNLFTYFPAAALILWGTKRYRLADLRPIARTRLLEQLQDGILVVDRAGSLIETNPAAENYLEISGQDAIGKTLKSVSSELAGVLDHYSQKKISTMIQFNSIPLQVTISPLVVRRGEDGGFLIILRDISDRLEAEKLKEMEIKRESAWVERKNIARTLHDSINQYLNSLVLLAGTASQRLEQAKYGQMEPVIRNISISVRQASKEMRALITELQLEAPSDRGFELVKALTERVNLISAQVDLHFHLNTPASLDLNSSQQREIFYIVLETLNNILQHAHANTVSIGLKQIEGQFIAEICDDGCGFDPGQLRDGGMGLANIKERTRLLNGALSISSMPGSGTCIRLALQLTPAKEETQ